MEKVKLVIALLGFGIAIGVILAVTFMLGMGAKPQKIIIGGVEFVIPTSTPMTQAMSVAEIPTTAPSNLPTNTPLITVAEILPEGVSSANEMPNWLATNVGGTPNQWQRLQNGKWKFKAGNSGGVGDNQILSPKVGYLVFGADSGKKDSNGGVIWKDVSIGPGESTFWRCEASNKPGTIDTADWTLFNPNIGTSCN